ncbi:glycosyltransferase family 43 [Teladorsagia circumcincta]|uniref:Galactosylgalactosylxylosylprotein 3-beta-glucuronosyltransferase n=1 Tax=Teladorsagia circumcincta TaxID=45464 RepID=A0A2G9UMS8_TELCI|nr:glycosyltransferase family 43 [Teladorsagia circumcincta]
MSTADYGYVLHRYAAPSLAGIGRPRDGVIFGALLIVACCLIPYVFPRWLCHIEQKLRALTKFSEPLIIVITPTYKRPTRFADMTRLANTLHLIPHLHWIVIEDGNETVPYVGKILERSTLPFTYFAAKTPKDYPGRGWYQRSIALQHLRKHAIHLIENYISGVVYFADDDNAYDTRVFTHYIRNVKKLGMWAVGLAGGLPVEYPITANGTVTGFYAWRSTARKFPVDMAGFALNLDVVLRNQEVRPKPSVAAAKKGTSGHVTEKGGQVSTTTIQSGRSYHVYKRASSAHKVYLLSPAFQEGQALLVAQAFPEY